jgi:gliding motility-associated-like protein
MKTVMTYYTLVYKFVLTAFAAAFSVFLTAQTLDATFSVPADNLINENFCTQVTLANIGNTGYQPYLRLFLPPQVSAATVEVDLLSQPVSDIVLVGVFSGGTLDDPNLPDTDPNNLVSGTTGYSYLNINLPIGSLIDGGVELVITICSDLSGTGVVADQAVVINTQAIYRYGDTPIGTNGSIAGDVLSGSILPKLYYFSYSADITKIATGECEYLTYDLIVDIADLKVVNGMVINAPVPSTLKYWDIISVTPGCIVTQEPALGSSGTIAVQCNNVVGADVPQDVKVSFLATVGDVLNDAVCGNILVTSSASVTSNQQPAPLTALTGVSGFHATFKPISPSSDVIPGNTVSIGFDYGVSLFVDGLSELSFSTQLPNGLQYLNAAYLNGGNIPAVVTNNPDGTTDLTFDLRAANGSDFEPCDVGTFVFEALILENYAGGGIVAAGDQLITDGAVTYDILNGTSGCTEPFSMAYGLDPLVVLKEIVTAPGNGANYVPGELITYRLTAEIPTGDASNVVFEDLFPIPVHDVTDLDLTFGTDIVIAPNDNAGLIPQNISIDVAKNKLIVDWGDVSSTSNGNPLVIAIDITIPISSAPFADGLTHTNFGRFLYDNSAAQTATSLALTSIEIGAPMLTFAKGVLTTDQPNATYSPVMIPVNANASHIDAWDWVTWRLTLSNIGDAPAYDVIVNDFPPTPQLGNCSVLSVKNGMNVNVPYTGNLFGAGLVVSSIPKNNLANLSDQVYIEYKCRVQGNIEAQNQITNEAQATWAAAPGSALQFDPLFETSIVYFERPEIEVNVLDIQPGYGSGNGVHVGEVVTFEALIEIPEGKTLDGTFSCVLPEGLSLEEFISFERPQEISFSIGSTNQVLAGLNITNIGSGTENTNRMITLPLGVITNAASDNDEKEYIRLVYSATVLNTAVNQNGYQLGHTATLQYRNPVSTALTTRTDTHTLEILEPELDVDIAFFNDQILPGDQTYVTLTISHKPTSTGTAFDVDLTNDLPIGLQFVSGSMLTECEDLLAGTPVTTFGSISAMWDSIPLGVSCQLVYTIQAQESFPPCTFAENCTSLKFSSCWNTHLDTLSYGPLNPLGVERTGTTIGLNDYNANRCSEVEVVSPTISTPTIYGAGDVCAGQSLNLFINQYQGVGVNYLWTGPGIQDGFNNYNWNLAQANTGMTGTYQVMVQIGNCYSELSAPFDLNVKPNPTVAVTNVSLPCASGADDLLIEPIVNSGTGPFTFSWNSNNYFSQDSIAVIENALPEDQGVYTLQVTDVFGCTSPIVQTLVSITSQPAAPVISGTNGLCFGDDALISATAYQGNPEYHWSTPSGQFVTNQNFVEWTPNLGESGDVTVFVVIDGCASEASVPMQVTVSQSPADAIFSVNTADICEGETLTFSTPVAAGSYAWSGPNGYSGQSSTPPAIESITVLGEGTYTLVVANGACQSTPFTLDVNVLPLPQTPGLQSNSPICIGEALDLSTSAVATFYTWTLPNGTQVTSESSQYAIAETLASNAGNYLLQIFDGVCWSLPSLVENVQIDIIPAEQAYAGLSIVACADQPFDLQAQNTNTLNGFWSTDDESLQIVSPNQASSAVLGAEIGNTYLFTWSLYNEGCGTYSTDEVAVYAPFPPTAMNDQQDLVEGTPADINVTSNDETGGVSYSITLIDLPDHGTAQVSGSDIIEYSPEDGYAGPDEITYELCLAGCPDMCTTATLKLQIYPYLDVPNIITPNGDGVNDALEIEGIERFASNEITIYNRWGAEVYQTQNYQNDWFGTWNGKPLPDGTYFYVLENTETGETLQNGYITIHQ